MIRSDGYGTMHYERERENAMPRGISPKARAVVRVYSRMPRLRAELAQALWELRRLRRVGAEAVSERAAVCAKLERERDERRRELWAKHGDAGCFIPGRHWRA